MQKLPKILAAALALVLVALLVLPAQARPPAGQYEAVKTHSAALSGDTALITGTSGKRIVLVGAIVRSSAAGVLVLKDGSAGTTIGNVYLPADTNVELTPDLLGAEGIRTTAGNGLFAAMSTNTITAVMRIRYE